jgi:hypothetical protein
MFVSVVSGLRTWVLLFGCVSFYSPNTSRTQEA